MRRGSSCMRTPPHRVGWGSGWTWSTRSTSCTRWRFPVTRPADENQERRASAPRRTTPSSGCEGSASAGPLLQERLVDLDAEARAVERQDRAVRVLHGPAYDVSGEQQGAEELAAPRHRR